jgi:hypothetical protein
MKLKTELQAAGITEDTERTMNNEPPSIHPLGEAPGGYTRLIFSVNSVSSVADRGFKDD